MLRILTAALAAAILLSFAQPAQAQEPAPGQLGGEPSSELGDVDCNGIVHVIDVLHILRLDVGLKVSVLCLESGDMNSDGVIDTVDAALVLQYTNGLIDERPPTPPEPLSPPASGGIMTGSADAVAGQRFSVTLEARGITAPGLGAWTIDVEYNTAVVTLVDCRAKFGAVCNVAFGTGILRVSGASAGGLAGDSELASLTFQCLAAEGVSDLTLTVRTLADATIGAPQSFVPIVTNGSITCAEAPLPTPRPGAGRLNITLIHDLNADGVFDPGEPGLEGWSVDVFPGCIDVFIALEATDAEGRTTAEAGQNMCVNVRQVGWVLTSGSSLVNVEPGTTVEAIFLFRKVGQEYFRLTGDLIVNGLPAREATTLDALVDGESCGDSLVGDSRESTPYSLYVLGEVDRAGCASEGQLVAITVNGEVVHEVNFTSNPWTNWERTDLVVGPTPMWFNASGRDGVAPVPYVGSVVCGEARQQVGALIPPDAYKIYVLPDALRSGCGAPGRIVTLRVGDEVLQRVVWKEGFVPFDELQDVVLPRVGGSVESGASQAGSYIVALLIAGLVLLFGGAVVRRAGTAG